jgi:hypothetical protein
MVSISLILLSATTFSWEKETKVMKMENIKIIAEANRLNFALLIKSIDKNAT